MCDLLPIYSFLQSNVSFSNLFGQQNSKGLQLIFPKLFSLLYYRDVVVLTSRQQIAFSRIATTLKSIIIYLYIITIVSFVLHFSLLFLSICLLASNSSFFIESIKAFIIAPQQQSPSLCRKEMNKKKLLSGSASASSSFKQCLSFFSFIFIHFLTAAILKQDTFIVSQIEKNTLLRFPSNVFHNFLFNCLFFI